MIPCVGACSTGMGDDVCRGCLRYVHEISGWVGYTATEKQAVLNRLDALKAVERGHDARYALAVEQYEEVFK